MISRIIEFCIRARLVVILATAAVAAWGLWCVYKTPVDAIPDLSENQVIVFADWMGRSPQDIDDQITYPLSVDLQGLAGVKAVRSSSEFNFSMITVIFEDNIDFYFARTRVQERLAAAGNYLPSGVTPYLAPDATALGQIFWYTVEGDGYSPDELRAIQDYYVRYQLYVPGVAQVASVGGMVREYQVDLDPQKLQAFQVPLGAVVEAIGRSNLSVGGKVFLEGQAEYLIRGVGWLSGLRDIENVVVSQRGGVPITVGQLAKVQLGPAFRRGILEKNGREATGGVVMMRYGENPLAVTQAIKDRIEQLQAGLPPGVRIVPFYDRTRLIRGAIGTLKKTLTEEMIIASLAILLILTHVRSAIVVCVTLPLAVLISFILMHYTGIASNIMSLAGLAISIGILVDAAVVMVENATHELTAHFGTEKVRGDTTEIVIRACRLVGKPIFFAVIIMLVSFLPIFALTGQEGKMFHPLAFTKTFAMVGVAILAVTFVPAIIPLLIKGHLRREEDNWIVRSFINIYKPVLSWLMKIPAAGVWFMAFLLIIGLGLWGLLGPGAAAWVLGLLGCLMLAGSMFFRRLPAKLVAVTLLAVAAMWAWHLPKLGREFMPPLDEGSVLDMPMTSPRISAAQAGEDLAVRDQVLASFPEVELVVGKVGRAETPTDPSGLDMVETIVSLRPVELWPKRKINYDDMLAESKLLADWLAQRGWLKSDLPAGERDRLINDSAMETAGGLETSLRELALRRMREYQPVLAGELTRETLTDLLAHLESKGALRHRPDADQANQLAQELTTDHGLLLVESPRQEEMNLLATQAVAKLAKLEAIQDKPDLLLPKDTPWQRVRGLWAGVTGQEAPSFLADLLNKWNARAMERQLAHAAELNRQLESYTFANLDSLLLDQLQRQALLRGAMANAPDPRAASDLAIQRRAVLAKGLFLHQRTKNELVKEMDGQLQMAGWGNVWTQPIINRVDMLATGVRTQIGVKVFGGHQEDLTEQVIENGLPRTVVREKGIQTIVNEIADVLKKVPGSADVFGDQISGRSYLQIEPDRQKAARYGVNVADVQEAVETAMGGMTVTTTVEGRRRFAVRVRYGRDFRQTQEDLSKVLVTARSPAGSAGAAQAGGGSPGMAAPGGAGGGGAAGMEAGSPMLIPITDVASVRVVSGPSMIKSENGMLRSYVQLNVRDRDAVGFVEEARQAVARAVQLPPGFTLEWTGQFEHQERAKRTLSIIFPVVLLLIFVMLMVTFNDWRDALLIILTVPGALVGGLIFQSIFGFNFSVAVWVGYVACFGMATQTGIVMLVYLHEAIRARGGLAAIPTSGELKETIIRGAVHRLRPKLMTEGVAIIGLMPMLWASGVGAEVIKPMAAPVLGGLLVADEVIDLVIPVIFNWYQQRRWRRQKQIAPQPQAQGA
jgi:Cu(I)/Ag(I) efflux system membrane protein CusA/SilA